MGTQTLTKQTTFVIIEQKETLAPDEPDDQQQQEEGDHNSYWDIPDDLQEQPEQPPNSYWDLPDNDNTHDILLQPTTSPSMNPYWVMADDVENGGAAEPLQSVDTDESEPDISTAAPEEEPTKEEILEELEQEFEQEEGEEAASSSEDASGTGKGSKYNNYPPPSAANYDPDADNGILESLRLYNSLRHDLPESFEREPDSNVDIITLPGDEEEQYAFCHLSTIIPFTQGDRVPFLMMHEDAAAIAMAVQDLNSGNGLIVPQIEGLPDRCRVRFTTEWADTEFQGGVALSHVVNNLGRVPGLQTPLPCAFLGALRSAVSIPTSIVTGLFGYPQISAASTSSDLDDPSQYPLFGRTLPADSGNAIPIIIYIRERLQVKHLAVVNVNDAYGNAFVEGMRAAAETYAPDMVIHQVPLDEGPGGIPAAVTALKATTFRFVFAIVFTADTHDAIMREATLQGVAGTGYHNWLFGDSFPGTLEGRNFEPDGVLHKAYRGSGLLEVTGGAPGVEKFDAFQAHMNTLHESPMDMELLGDMFPNHDYEEYNAKELYTGPDNDFLKGGVGSGYATFMYEAVIALGLAACEASNANPDGLGFTGQQHFEYFKNSSFDGFSKMVLDQYGSRDAAKSMYKVTNYQEELGVDEETGEPVVRFVRVITDLFQEGTWNATDQEFIFNDGTPNLPDDLPPIESGGSGINTAIIIVVPLAVLAALAIGVFFYLDNKRKKNDSVWVVSREDIKFADPPEIIGRGTFGLVLLGEYRGTQVAVKRVIPPKKQKEAAGSGNPGNMSVMASGIFTPRESVSGVFNGMISQQSDPSSAGTGATSGGFKGVVGTVAGGINTGVGAVAGGVGAVAGGLGTVAGGVAGGLGTVAGGIGKGIGKGIGSASSMVGVGHVSLALGKKRSTETEAQVWKRMKKEFMEEMRYLSKLRHPCITTVMGAVTKGEPMLIMEYMDHGSLYDLLHNETMVIEGELILPLLKDITQGIRFLHSANPQVIHGDLKAANILVDNRFRAKVADFGLSQKQNLGGTGTPYWMAPELLRKESCNTSATDVYSFGIILYEVFSRRDPYEDEDYDEVMQLVADKKVQKRPPAPRHMPDAVKALMQDCVEDDPEKRPLCEELDTRLKRIDADAVNASQNTGKSATVSLFDIFPRHIAEALRDGRTVEPEHKDCVTIFFSDIVGFTTISSELEPRKVANMLDRLYTRFDALSNHFDIFKVETIGDAYMAVTNLVKDQEDHAARIAQFAIQAIAAANETMIDMEDETKGCVNIRVGFHSGSVVADVVGTRNPRYCLFGDTVNTASRMESNSEVNRIHCSRAAAKLLQQQVPELPIKSRGKVKIKGKGNMHTYWVNEAGHRGSSLMSQNSTVGLMKTMSQSSLDSSDGDGVKDMKGRRKDDVRSSTSSTRMSRTFSTLLGKTPIDQISEAPSMEMSMRDGSMISSQYSDIESPEEAYRAPEVAPEPRPIGAAGESFHDI